MKTFLIDFCLKKPAVSRNPDWKNKSRYFPPRHQNSKSWLKPVCFVSATLVIFGSLCLFGLIRLRFGTILKTDLMLKNNINFHWSILTISGKIFFILTFAYFYFALKGMYLVLQENANKSIKNTYYVNYWKRIKTFHVFPF